MRVCALDQTSDAIAAPTGPTRRWAAHGPGAPGREAVEAFIRGVYARRYGADPYSFAPVLVALHQDDVVVAAAGYRTAAGDDLFLERYLDGPIERVLSAHTREPISRDAIVEVGHLSTLRAGAGWHLVRRLGPHLAALGLQCVVSTMTQGMRRMFLRAGIAPVALAPADPRALGPEAARWGSYYEHAPVVVAGTLQQALHRLGRSGGDA